MRSHNIGKPKKMRSHTVEKFLFILFVLFLIGLIFCSYVIYASFNVAEEQKPTNVGKISFTVVPKPENPPQTTGMSIISFRVIEKPEE